MRHWDAQDVERDDAIFSPFVTASSAVIICYKNTDWLLELSLSLSLKEPLLPPFPARLFHFLLHIINLNSKYSHLPGRQFKSSY